MLEPGCRNDAVVSAAPAATLKGVALLNDQTTGSNGVPVDTLLSYAVEANKQYIVRVCATVGRDSGTAGAQFALSGPSGASIEGFFSCSGNALTNVVSFRYTTLGVIGGTNVPMNVTGQVEFWGCLTVGSTAGFITFQFCCGGATTVRRLFAGSRLEILEISGTTEVALAANETTTSTGPVSTALALNLAANKKYLVRFDGSVQNSGGGSGIGFSAPSGATIAGWRPMAPNNSTRVVKEITAFDVITTGTDGGSAISLVQIWAYVTTGATAGALTILFGSTTGGATTTMFAGATMQIVEVATA